ncbi:hypothetical protein AN1V17_12080 [Vallitalea sediminicola]
MKKQVISLMMAVCLLFTFSLTANAAVKDGITYYAVGYNSNTGKVGAAMYSDNDDENFEVVLKYYDLHNEYIDTETYIKKDTSTIEFYDVVPKNANHVVIKFYHNNKKLDEVWLSTTD